MGPLKVYEWRGSLWQFAEGDEPEGAVERAVPKAAAPRAKAKAPADKARRGRRAPADKGAR